ncbi:hypothetical protein V8C86DRAFT_2658589 [Haematococcus lacustris]
MATYAAVKMLGGFLLGLRTFRNSLQALVHRPGEHSSAVDGRQQRGLHLQQQLRHDQPQLEDKVPPPGRVAHAGLA